MIHETIRQWCQKFGSDYARKLKKRQSRLGDIWHIDEVFVTIKLRSYDTAHRTVMPPVHHMNYVHANNRPEVSHELTSQRERHMRRLSSSTQAQQFLTLYGIIQNLFRLGRHLIQAVNYRLLRTQAFQVWQEAVCA